MGKVILTKEIIDDLDYVRVLQIPRSYIDDDVKSWILGTETFYDNDLSSAEHIYMTIELHDMARDGASMIATTKEKIRTLYEFIKDFDYYMLID